MITSFQIGSFMKYKSTRGGVHGLSFEDALYTGYASDGGIM
jgi:threonine synthase